MNNIWIIAAQKSFFSPANMPQMRISSFSGVFVPLGDLFTGTTYTDAGYF